MSTINKLRKINFCHIFTLIWCAYYVFAQSGHLFTRITMFFILGVFLYYTYYANVHYRGNQLIKALNFLVLMFSIYGLLAIVFGRNIYHTNFTYAIPSYLYIRRILMSLLPIYTYYVFAKQGKLVREDIWMYLVLFMMVSMVFYFREATFNYEQFDTEEFTNNAGKYFVFLIPLLFYIERPLFKYLLLGVIFFFIVSSVKRGSMFVGGILMVLLFVNESKRAKGWKGFLTFFLLIISIIAAYFFISYQLQNNSYFSYRWEKTNAGDSNGRDVLTSTALNIFLNETSIWQFVFGHGSYATVELMGQYAHNDWMEIAVNNGLIGLVVYFAFYVSFIKYCRRRKHSWYFPILLSYLAIILFFSVFSMGYEDLNIFYGLGLGFCLAQTDNVVSSVNN